MALWSALEPVEAAVVEWTRLGVVDVGRDRERMWFVCRVCDTRTDFPFHSELADWAGRSFLFVHEHRDMGGSLRAEDIRHLLPAPQIGAQARAGVTPNALAGPA